MAKRDPESQENRTLVELLRHRAQLHPDRRLYRFLADGEDEETRLSYADLDRRARTLGARLQSQTRRGDRVLLLYLPGLDFVTAFFGCLYGGLVAVPAYPPRRRNNTRLLAIAHDAKPVLALTTPSLKRRVMGWIREESDLQGLQTLASDEDDNPEEAWQEPAIGPESLAFLQYTSGSTAAPKGVMVSHGNLLHNQRALLKAFPRRGDLVVVGWLPLFHDMGLIGNVLHPLFCGGEAVLMSPLAFLQKPERWLRAISRFQASISGGPNFAYDLCVQRIDDEVRQELDLSAWKVAFNGAEPVRAPTLERFSEAFADCGFSRNAFFPCFGLAEATLLVSGGRAEGRPHVARVSAAGLEQDRWQFSDGGESGRQRDNDGRTRDLVSSGICASEQRVSIVHPQTMAPCPADRIGEIWVAGPSVAQGYWGHPRQTEVTFGARTTHGQGPFLRTGDLGQ